MEESRVVAIEGSDKNLHISLAIAPRNLLQYKL